MHIPEPSDGAVRSPTARPLPITNLRTRRICNRLPSDSRTRAANGVCITIVDTPGFIPFFKETKQALAGVDAAVVVVEADPGRIVEMQAIVDDRKPGAHAAHLRHQ